MSSLSSGVVAIIIASIVVGGIVIIVIAILIIRWLERTRMQSVRSQNHTQSSDAKIEMEPIQVFLSNVLKEKPLSFTPQNLIDYTRNYSNKLGSGGFGVVYKGELPNGLQIAVKVLKGTTSKKAEEQFMAEIATIGRTYHINLVRLYGFCFHESVKALVYEYMEKGSLDNYLFAGSGVEWAKLHEITIGTAKGIRYLHEECRKIIVHYDIKPANILLTDNFNPKVADFGLACLCDREDSSHTSQGVRGTPGYAAPELWMDVPVTYKCDVYSFGMLLLEVLGRRRNLEFNRTESKEWFPRWVWQKFDQGELESIVSLCGIDEKDRDKAQRMCQVALWCVQYDQDARPSMTSVVRMLEGEQEIVPPVNPFLYLNQDQNYGSSTSPSGFTTYSASADTANYESDAGNW